MSQIYISTPNPVMLCFNHVEGFIREGYLYHPYHKEGIHFEGVEQIFHIMENLFNDLHFPFSATTDRTLLDKKEVTPIWQREQKVMERVWSNEELMKFRGEKATFLIQVQQRQNSSWHGKVSCLEEGVTRNFQSALELIKYIEKSMQTKDITF